MFSDEERVRFDFAYSAESLKRWDIADQRWDQARAMFPDNSIPRLRRDAWCPHKTTTRMKPSRGCEYCTRAFPDDIEPYAEYIDLLRKQNRIDEALAYAENPLGAFPRAASLALEYARTESRARRHPGSHRTPAGFREHQSPNP